MATLVDWPMPVNMRFPFTEYVLLNYFKMRPEAIAIELPVRADEVQSAVAKQTRLLDDFFGEMTVEREQKIILIVWEESIAQKCGPRFKSALSYTRTLATWAEEKVIIEALEGIGKSMHEVLSIADEQK